MEIKKSILFLHVISISHPKNVFDNLVNDLKYALFQIVVKEPMPEAKEKNDSFEDTLLLLDMVRERKSKEGADKKVTYQSTIFKNNSSLQPGREDQSNGDGAKEEEADEGELLHPQT